MTAALGPRFGDALAWAAQLHGEQRRKGSDIPYVSHLLAVCSLVIEDGGSEDEAIAALLHDAVEDQGGEPTLEQIRARWGNTVADIVRECSDTTAVPKPPWRERKEAYVTHLDRASSGTLRVSLADKLHNARAVLFDYRAIGEELWERFNAGRDDVLWYYRALADAFTRLAGGPLAAELERTVVELERLAGPPKDMTAAQETISP